MELLHSKLNARFRQVQFFPTNKKIIYKKAEIYRTTQYFECIRKFIFSHFNSIVYLPVDIFYSHIFYSQQLLTGFAQSLLLWTSIFQQVHYSVDNNNKALKILF